MSYPDYICKPYYTTLDQPTDLVGFKTLILQYLPHPSFHESISFVHLYCSSVFANNGQLCTSQVHKMALSIRIQSIPAFSVPEISKKIENGRWQCRRWNDGNQ